MDFHVITPSGVYLVMKTWEGKVLEVWPAPADSLPACVVPVPQVPGR
jgi:hypothetical protein